MCMGVLAGKWLCLARLQFIMDRRNIHWNLSHGFVFSANTELCDTIEQVCKIQRLMNIMASFLTFRFNVGTNLSRNGSKKYEVWGTKLMNFEVSWHSLIRLLSEIRIIGLSLEIRTLLTSYFLLPTSATMRAVHLPGRRSWSVTPLGETVYE